MGSINRVLVVGYGNELRSDDAVGQKVAREIAAWQLPWVKSEAVHQLTPELTTQLTTVEVAIFVDAHLPSQSSDVQIAILPSALELTPPLGENIMTGHTSHPQNIIALTQAIYSLAPIAWWVKIPGINFDIGDKLSPLAESNMQIALVKIRESLSQVSNR